MISIVDGDSMQDVLTQVYYRLLRDEDLATIGVLRDDIETVFLREGKKACFTGKALSSQGGLRLRCEVCD